MRIYLYITTPFVATSSYIQNGISVISARETSILNFLGQPVLDAVAKDQKSYVQLQPAPIDGSMPLATNRWNMNWLMIRIFLLFPIMKYDLIGF